MVEENKHNYDVYWNEVSIFKFTLLVRIIISAQFGLFDIYCLYKI